VRRSYQEDEDYRPAATAAGSAEPFMRPDHRAKRHPKPRYCRGRFALRWVRGAKVEGE